MIVMILIDDDMVYLIFFVKSNILLLFLNFFKINNLVTFSKENSISMQTFYIRKI